MTTRTSSIAILSRDSGRATNLLLFNCILSMSGHVHNSSGNLKKEKRKKKKKKNDE